MVEARHAAVVAGLGMGGVFTFPSPAAAWEATGIYNILTETPGLAFAIGAVAGFAVVGALYGVSQLLSGHEKQATGRHFASNVETASKAQAQAQPAAEIAAPAPTHRHMRMDAEPTTPATGAHARKGRHFATTAAVEAEEPLSLAARVPSPEITDYINVAERYVSDERGRKNKAMRSRGVASVLIERMDLQKGFPTIERGVSQVEEVGSWWDEFEPVTSNVTAAPAPVVHELTESEKRTIARENAAKRRKAERISRSVAQIDQGVYPELRTADDLDETEDLWAMALSAMDDLMPPVVFSDNVGNADTIDEPDGLEPNTNFLTFRAARRRPELYDTASLVNYLVGDELARSRSATMRSRSVSYLKVIEGGTQSTGRVGRHTRGTRELEPVSYGKHFVVAAEA